MVGVLAHLYRIQDAQVPDLIVADPIHKQKSLLFLVRLNAPDEVHVSVCRHLGNQLPHLFPDLDAQVPFVPFMLQLLVLLAESISDELYLDRAQSHQQVLSYQVLVLLPETFDHILDVARSVPDHKRFPGVYQIARREMVMMIVLLFYTTQKIIIFYVY